MNKKDQISTYNQDIVDLKRNLLKLRIQKSLAELKDISLFKKNKKKIAQLMTKINSKV